MPEEQLRDLVDAMRTRIQTELDNQLEALTARHQQAIEQIRADADAEAEQRWATRIDAVRSEWSARLDSEVTAARSEAEKRLVAESMRVRVDAEQAATEAAAAQRRELEQTVAAERQRAEIRVETERRRAEQHLEQTLAALEAERRQAESQLAVRTEAPAIDPQEILTAVQSIEAASSLSDALTALAQGAARQGARATVFIVNGNRLDEWNADEGSRISAGSFRADSPEAGFLRDVVRQGRTETSGPDDRTQSLPAFASLPPGGAAVAVPVVVGGRVVAVLYGDGGEGVWRAALELLGHHASACLARLTAVRALQLLQSGNGAAVASTGAAPPVPEDDQSARRYARLLVSEIKLYNEAAVRLGREKRDLLQRLKPEIERARRLYEERVPETVAARGFYFHQELVQTLADGDAALLGA